jgi:hypothetical protein
MAESLFPRYEEHEVLASLVKRFKKDISDYIEFLTYMYFCMKSFVRDAGDYSDDGKKCYTFDTYMFSHERRSPLSQSEMSVNAVVDDCKYGIPLGDIFSLRDFGLAVIESMELFKPGFFRATLLQDIVDSVQRLEYGRDCGELSNEWRAQVEFSLALDRYFFTVERLGTIYFALGGDDKGVAEFQSQLEPRLFEENNDDARPQSRRNAIRDAAFADWRSKGMTIAQIRDRWNAENPNEAISLENANSGRETVRNAIRRELLRKTPGTR